MITTTTWDVEKGREGGRGGRASCQPCREKIQDRMNAFGIGSQGRRVTGTMEEGARGGRRAHLRAAETRSRVSHLEEGEWEGSGLWTEKVMKEREGGERRWDRRRQGGRQAPYFCAETSEEDLEVRREEGRCHAAARKPEHISSPPTSRGQARTRSHIWIRGP